MRRTWEQGCPKAPLHHLGFSQSGCLRSGVRTEGLHFTEEFPIAAMCEPIDCFELPGFTVHIIQQASSKKGTRAITPPGAC